MPKFLSDWFNGRSSVSSKIKIATLLTLTPIANACSIFFSTRNGTDTYKADIWDSDVCDFTNTFLSNNTCGAQSISSMPIDRNHFETACGIQTQQHGILWRVEITALNGTQEVITDALRCFLSAIQQQCNDNDTTDLIIILYIIGGIVSTGLIGWGILSNYDYLSSIPSKAKDWYFQKYTFKPIQTAIRNEVGDDPAKIILGYADITPQSRIHFFKSLSESKLPESKPEQKDNDEENDNMELGLLGNSH